MADETMLKLNPTNGHMLAGVRINDHLFQARLITSHLFNITNDPRDAEDKRKVAASKELQELREMREDVQRVFEGRKAKNVPSYADYICALHRNEIDGMTPPIILFSEKKLEDAIDEYGKGFIQVPFDTSLVAIDGETQLAARYEAANLEPDTRKDFVAIYVAHGRDKNWARQAFYDLNVLAVRPNAALSIGMDARDPLTRVARELERRVPFFTDRVNKNRRQLRKTDTDVVTITALRGACVTLAEGIGGVQHGTRPVHIPDQQIPGVVNVGVEWFSAVTSLLGTAMENREKTLASAPSILAAIGAMGHELVKSPDEQTRHAMLNAQLDKLRNVDWQRGQKWEGIAGKFTPKGTFSVGGSKETAYAVYEALNDPTSAGYAKVRKTNTEVAA